MVPLKAVIEPVTTALGLPNAGPSLKTKAIVYMTTPTKLGLRRRSLKLSQSFSKGSIGTLNETSSVLNKRVSTLTAMSEGGGSNAK